MQNKSLIFFFIFLLSFCSYSQDNGSGSRIHKLTNVIPPSPEAASLGKYGDVPVGLFTGVPQISIPLYSLKEGSMELPISISYHSRGVRVSEIASSVGLGWSLNAGGVITRTVRGVPDESNTGYFFRDTRMAPLTLPIPSTLTSAQYMSLENLAYSRSDLDADMFNYSFLGRSGKFFFDHNKNIHMITPEDIKIEVSTDFGTWTIKDENGNKYIFSTGEQTISTTNQDTQSEAFTSSWYLTYIITREGKQIDFYYTAPVAIIQDEMLSETDKYRLIPQVIPNYCFVCPYYNGQIQKITSTQTINTVKLQRIESSAATIFFERNATQREDLYGDHPLENIKVQSKATNDYVRNYHFNYTYFEGNRLPGYGSVGGDGNKRLKLLNIEDVTDPGQGPLHKFYYDETVLPPRDSYAQDHWGYYNGADFNTTMLPQTDGLPLGVPYGNRNSNGTFSSAGVLSKIEYPTGGSTSFTFEPNQSLIQETIRKPLYTQVSMTNQPGGTESSQAFSVEEGQWIYVIYQVTLGNYPAGNTSAQLIITNQDNEEVVHNYGEGNLTYPVFFPPGQYLMNMISPDIPESNLHAEITYHSGPISQTVNKIVGGIRIKQTTDFDPVVNKSIIKKYEYPSTALLTGPRTNDDYLLNHKERCPIVCPILNGPWGANWEPEYFCDYQGRTSASRYSFGDITGGHIGYQTAKVVYGLNGENGYSESSFNYSSPIEGGGFPYTPALVYDSRNGLLLAQKDYNAAGNLMKQATNSYQFEEKYRELSVKVGFLYDDPLWDAFSQGYHWDEITYSHYYIVSETVKKTSTTVTQFDVNGNNPVTSTTNYYYDNPQHSMVTREEVTDSKGNLLRTQNSYPYDYAGNAVYAEMLNRNMVAPIIEQTQTNVTLSKQLSHAKTNYQFWQNNNLLEPVTVENSLLGQPLQTELTVTAYDDKGNILEFTGKDGVINSIIWGYNKQYPVAKITGKSYSDAISQSGINLIVVNNPANDNSLRTELNKLRNVSGVFATTYTYKPLVGTSSVTDPRGITTFYEYDNSGRLALVRDHNNNIVKKICYNYAGQAEACSVQLPVTYYNAALSQVFTRNNCSAGYSGSQVIYTVAANTYSSTISQADANQQAQNDINANGQAYANANGTCTQFTCNTGNCTGDDKKCISGVCETGVRINKSSTYSRGVWTCIYVYRWSDCSESQEFSETGSSACTIGPLCGN